MAGKKSIQAARREAKSMGLQRVRRQILLCGDTRRTKCSSKKEMQRSWRHLKRRLKQLKMEDRGSILRIRTYCLGICKGGPIMVVIPDGVWYGQCTPAVVDRIVDEHLIDGNVVEEFRLASSPMDVAKLSIES